MKLVRNVVVLVVVLGLAGFVSAADATKKKDKPKAAPAVTGVVQSVDGAKVTVKTPAKKGAPADEVVVETNDKTVVTIDGKEAKVADLKKGMQVKITPKTGAAEKIVAATPKPKKEGKGGAKKG